MFGCRFDIILIITFCLKSTVFFCRVFFYFKQYFGFIYFEIKNENQLEFSYCSTLSVFFSFITKFKIESCLCELCYSAFQSLLDKTVHLPPRYKWVATEFWCEHIMLSLTFVFVSGMYEMVRTGHALWLQLNHTFEFYWLKRPSVWCIK